MPIAAAGLPGLMAGYGVKTTVVLVAALIAVAAAKKRPAAFRHFILTSALIGLLLLPLLMFVPLGWRSSLLPAWMAVSAPRAPDAAEKQAADLPAGVPAAGQVPTTLRPGDGANRRTAWAVVPSAPGEESLARHPGPSAIASIERTAGLAVQPKRTRPGIVGLLLAGLWAAGLAVLLLRLAFGLSGAVRLTAEGTPLEGASWRLLLERFLAFVSLRREVRLRSHPGVLVPMTWGFRKPIVLFPEGADAWTEDERTSALYHELAHVKRADFLAMLLVRASLALFWWNPLCWAVYREILKEQEIACDELVLRAGIRPSTYAASLLAFRRAAGFRWNPSAALLGMLGRSSFQERLAAILKQKITFMEVKMKTKIMLALALLVAVVFVGTARPAVDVEKGAVKASVTETAAPALPSLDAVPASTPAQQVQAEQATAQEKQKEKEKAIEAEKAKDAERVAKGKAVTAKTIVIKPKGGEGEPVEITITEGDTTKTLILEKSLTITKEGGALVVTPEGQEPLVLKGEPLILKIKGEGLEVTDEGQVLRLGEPVRFKIVKEGQEPGDTVVFHAREPEKGFTLVKPGEEGQTFKVVKKGEGGAIWVIEEPEKGATDTKMLERVQALEEQVQAIKAKKMDISALEESLKKLEAELKAKEEKPRTFEYELDKEPVEVVAGRQIEAEKEKGAMVRIITEGQDIRTDKTKTSISVRSTDKGPITLIFGKQGLTRQDYERATAELKKALPEGAKISGSDFDEQAGTIKLTVAMPEGKPYDKTLIEKLVEIVSSVIDRK
jgi:beta-lactamase regulating signal transducer with metallopeptidase domain